MLERRIEQEIREFLKSGRKEAMMVTGARQVGKTYIIREWQTSKIQILVRVTACGFKSHLLH